MVQFWEKIFKEESLFCTLRFVNYRHVLGMGSVNFIAFIGEIYAFVFYLEEKKNEFARIVRQYLIDSYEMCIGKSRKKNKENG